MQVNRGNKSVWQFVSTVLPMMFAAVFMLIGGTPSAAGQACSAQNWTASTPNIWAAGPSVKVMLNNAATTNQPTIPTFLDDGNFNPWGWSQHPQTIAELNSVWSCPSGTPTIAVAGAGRETVSFQVFITAGMGTGAALTDVSVTVSPLTGAGTTLTSDNTNNSNVDRYLEGYLPFTSPGSGQPATLQSSGKMPDPLIPFYDPYDSGNPAVATPFNVSAATTQGVWVNISIPANQTAGAYSGTVTVSGNGIGTVSIPVQLTVWNGTLPAFDEGSINSSYADMLKAWFPMYEENLVKGDGLNCANHLVDCTSAIQNVEQYQIMAHSYDADAQVDGLGPDINGCYPTGSSNTCTSFTTNGTTSSINWTNYDAMVGPALKAGGLFSDGTYMRFFDSPLSNAGNGAWVGGNWNWYNWENNGTTLPPAGLLQLVNNYVTQISQHFAANHSGSAGWGLPELTSYTFDETYNAGHSKDLGGTPVVYQQIAQYNQAINCANAGQPYNCTGSLGTWSASAAPVHNLLTDEPPCKESGDDTAYTNAACSDHINLSYPGAANSTAGFPNGQVNIWSPNPFLFTSGQPGPALAYGYGTTLVAGTGYKYTLDLTQGVTALSALPVPIERWFYQGGAPASAGDTIDETGVGQRINFWIAYKYGLDETIASTGDPSPAAPAPGGVWVFTSNFYAGEPSSCTASGGGSYSNTSPYIDGAGGDGQLFFPGNQIGCYYTNNPVGEVVLTKSPAVNTSCTSNGYSACNGISGPVASIRMEAWRRGYQDYEYLYLLGKQSGRSAAMAVINALGGAGITAGGDGTTSWQALNWQNVDSDNYITGVEPITAAYTGNCTDSTAGLGGLAGGLPNGPLGMANAGSGLNYNACPGEWTNNPYRIEAARVQLAQDLGWASSSPIAATPTFSPAAGTYTSAQTVTISDSTSGATIYYTTDGSTPTTSSTKYTAPITVSATETVNAIATASGYAQSAVGSATYTISAGTVATPTFSPAAGTYTSAQTVTISDSTSGATIYYTTDGSTPTTSSPVYSSSITVSATETVKALGVKSGYTNSAVGSAAYTINLPAAATPTFSPAAGTYTSAQTVTISDSTSGATIYYTTNGTTPTTSSTKYTAPITVSASETVEAIATASGYSQSAVGSATYTITGLPVAATPTFSPAAGTYGSAQTVTISDSTSGATIYYTTNGTTPTTSSSVYSSPITVSTSETVEAIATASGYAQSAVGSAAYTINSSGGTTPSIVLTPGIIGSLAGIQGGTGNPTSGEVASGNSIGAPAGIAIAPMINGTGGDIYFDNCTESDCGYSGAVYVIYEGGAAAKALLVADGVASPTVGEIYPLTSSNETGPASPAGIAVDSYGNVLVTDWTFHRVYLYYVGTVSGQGANPADTLLTTAFPESSQGLHAGYTYHVADGSNVVGSAPTAPAPNDVYVDSAENIFFTDRSNNVEVVYNTSGTSAAAILGAEGYTGLKLGYTYIVAGGQSITTYPNDNDGGSSVAYNGGTSTANTAINAPWGIYGDAAGNIYFADSGSNKIKKLSASTAVLTTIGGPAAGTATTVGFAGDGGLATAAQMHTPYGLVVDNGGSIYFTDTANGSVRRIDKNGYISTVSGISGTSGTYAGNGGNATAATMGQLEMLSVDASGNLYISDRGNDLIDKVATNAAAAGTVVPTAVNNSGKFTYEGNFAFGNQAVNTSSSPATALISNITGSSVTLSGISIPSGYTQALLGNTDVPDCTTTTAIASGTSCTLALEFSPTAAGADNGSATVTANGQSVTIAVTGTGTGGTTVATPTFSPAAGTYTSAQTVTISDSTSGATIYYTTDGSTPTTSSTKYTAPITVSTTETVKAIATASGYSQSAVGSAAYTINLPAATPTFSPAAGTYTSTQTVTISDSTSGAAIYYTTDGSTPTTSSTKYTAPITVSTTETVKAIATASGYSQSAVGSAAYTINLPAATPTFSPAAGTYTSSQTVTISDSTSGATIYYTTDGSTPTTSSTKYTAPITVSTTETVKAIATASGYSQSAVGSAAYTISGGTVATPTFSPGSGSNFTAPGQVTISDSTSGAVIHYTTDGSTPTASSPTYSSPITLSGSSNPTTVKAIGVESGYTNSAVGSANYYFYVARPSWTPGNVVRGTPQTVSLSDATPGVTFYYTRDGSTPTTSSPVYTGPFTVSQTETDQAIATYTGWGTSTVGSATVTLQVNTINFSPGIGHFTSPQTVTLSTTSPGVTIHYTTDGSTPTASSPTYTGPITISTTTTLSAIGVESGWTNSGVSSGTYYIQ